MNCIWITTDSFRQDHVHCYRPEGTVDDTGPSLQVHTPNLDRLAGEGVLFERMRAEALPTIPCRRGIFTGRRVFPWQPEPRLKGLYPVFPGWYPIPQDDVTVAEHLSAQGYVTAIFADTYHIMKPSMNFHRGFDGFHWIRGQEFDRWRTQPLAADVLERHMKPELPLEGQRARVLTQFLQNHEGITAEGDLPAGRTSRNAISWLEANRGHERFFLYVDTFSPHEPWLAPAEYLELYEKDYSGPDLIYGNPYRRGELTDAEHAHLRARYAAMCTMVDKLIGDLLAAVERLGLRESTLIILMSDHGKIIGEFGCYGMPAECTGPALNPVPCIIRHPAGENAGKRFGGWLYNIDLAATVLDLLDMAPKADVEGESVWPAVSDGDTFRDHLVTAYKDIVAAWRDDWLCIFNRTREELTLYDLGEDPHRTNDLSRRYPDLCRELAAKIRGVLDG